MNSWLTRLGLLAIGIICIGLGVKRISDHHDFQQWANHLTAAPLSFTPGIPTTEAAMVDGVPASTGTTDFGSAVKTYAPQGAEIITPENPISKNSGSSFASTLPLAVINTPSIYQSSLPLLGSYKVGIPADNQWHGVILIKPNTELRINTMFGSNGKVMFKVGSFSTLFSKQLPDNSWYQYDFRTEWNKTIYDHYLQSPATLYVKLADMNQSVNQIVRIELRKL